MYDFLLTIADIIGMIGVLLILTAYFFVSMDIISSNNMKYLLVNTIAAGLILFSLYFHWNTPAAVIEIAWIIISIVGMIRILNRRLNKKKSRLS